MEHKNSYHTQGFSGSLRRLSRMRSVQNAGHALLALALSTATFQSALANVNLASAPVFLKESVDPNLLFIFDDSGSMAREYMPDNLSRDDGQRWYYSSKVNTIYYDPTLTYLAPFKPDGTGRFPDSNFNSAWRDGYEQSGSVNLANTYRTHRNTFDNPAFYYRFNSTDQCESNPKNNNCYSLVFLTNESAEQQQNFANWYSYYNRRDFASRAGISEAFFDLPPNIRVGYGAINSNGNSVDGQNTDTIISGVRPFSAARRQQFLGWLQSKSVGGGTPLRTALKDAGGYYSRSDNKGPWGNNPGTNDTSSHVECRPSYTILMTDGIYNGSDPGVGNPDGTPGPSHTNPDPEGKNFNYESKSPFADTYSNTLADVAMEYWKKDLRPTIADKVPTAGIDEAFWQHMTTFTIGLGVNGTISETDAFAAIKNGNTITWPEPNTSERRIDDLLHASVNGRGGFASAQNPDEFSKEIAAFLDTVIARAETSASAAAVSSAVLRTESAGFFAGFRSEDWSGTLTGFSFDSGSEIWDAEETLRNTLPANRNIITHNGSSAVELKDIRDLAPNQANALNADPENPGQFDNLGTNRIAWIRGAENAHSSFRNRDFTNEAKVTVRRLLGDIVNANPLFVSNSNYGFSRLPGTAGTSYAAFRSTPSYQTRTEALYVAANDGMLHAFDSDNGEELFAYMPGELLTPAVGSSHAQISSLMSSNYTHRYFMDGSPKALDAYINTDGTTKWRTILVGSMGAGGRSVFAIDITNPNAVNKDKVLWEFSHPDLGFGVSDPEIARLPNGEWVAIFGNGYNGDDEKASLFVVRLSDGTLLKQFETGAGGSVSPNGLAAPVLTNFPDRGAITQYVYAGDLLGNLWRFDLLAKNPSNWSLTKVFTAVGPGGDAQPITVSPRLTINPSDLDKLIVTVGTGSFIRNGDDTTDQVQTLYAIIDDLTETNLTRSNLLEQTITRQDEITVARADGSGDNKFTVRKTSDNKLTTQKGWYLDLIYNGQKTGERVISRASFPFGIFPDRVRFSTLIPDPNPCGSGRRGFIMDLNLVSGGAPYDPVFDLNSDGEYSKGDLVGGGGTDYAPSGIDIGEGAEIRTITDGESEAFITDPTKIDKDDPCKSAVCGKTLENSIGRQTWEQLR
ncbi:pilus assembly protein [Marinobacter alexandrii]|uniref:pilus assembly protein n=1 Tax=Marinobacter alexandrii TaxID=2570351 RepID=UPI001109DB85|nr:PilC/PilY family type IV pilus protein [Marinobacter alexandrii]